MKVIVLAALILFTIQGALAGGDHVGNGGDLCEMKFQRIRDDLSLWIQKGGSTSLQLPEDIKFEAYEGRMLSQISKAHVSCTDENVYIGSAEKTCRNWIDANNESRILCNRQHFLNSSDSDLYRLVHHEYAGLSSIEVSTGETSNYLISRQISVSFDLPLKTGIWEFGGGFGLNLNQEDSQSRTGSFSVSPQIQYFLKDDFSFGGAFQYMTYAAARNSTPDPTSYSTGLGPSATYYFYSKNRQSFYFSQKFLNVKKTVGGNGGYSNFGQSELGARFFFSASVAFGIGYTYSYSVSDSGEQYGHLVNGSFIVYH